MHRCSLQKFQLMCLDQEQKMRLSLLLIVSVAYSASMEGCLFQYMYEMRHTAGQRHCLLHRISLIGIIRFQQQDRYRTITIHTAEVQNTRRWDFCTSLLTCSAALKRICYLLSIAYSYLNDGFLYHNLSGVYAEAIRIFKHKFAFHNRCYSVYILSFQTIKF